MKSHFDHKELNLKPLSRKTIDGVRYYDIDGKDGPLKLVSITSVISNYKKEFFEKWRQRVGAEAADKKTKRATSRGIDMHTLVEHHLKNESLPKVQPLSEFLFHSAKALEGALYSEYLGIAGTVDCIAEHDGELSIIDFKTSERPKPRDWIDGYFVQCCAYACMLHEMTGLTIKKFVIIMSCENGEVVVYEERDKEKYIRMLVQYIKKFLNDKLTK